MVKRSDKKWLRWSLSRAAGVGLILFCLAGTATGAKDTTGNYLKRKIEAADPKEKVQIYIGLFLEMEFTDKHKAEGYLQKALLAAEESNDPAEKAYVLIHFGYFEEDRSDFVKALEYYFKALRYSEKSGDDRGMAGSHNSIGGAYLQQGNDSLALIHYFEAEKYYLKMKYDEGLSSLYNNISSVYGTRQENDKALRFLKKSRLLDEKRGSKESLAKSTANLALYYEFIAEATEKVSLREKYRDSAMILFQRALELNVELDDHVGMASGYSNLGSAFFVRKDYPKAKEFSLKGVEYSRQTRQFTVLRNSYSTLSRTDSALGNFSSSLHYYKLMSLYKDSLLNDDINRKTMQTKIQYEYDKKSSADSITNAKQQQIKDAEIKQKEAEIAARRNQQYALFGGLFLVLVFGGVMYNRFRITRRQKEIIEIKEKETQQQKHVIEEKQKEIIDSINYAQRLQQAILAPVSEIEKVLPGSFLLYRPKDIVAGDFYFFETTADFIFYAAADCTGHGVPGAMVSVVCSNALTRSVKEFDLTDPAHILDKSRELILDTFNKSGQDVKDGMDISLIGINRANREIRWAGAHNPLWYISNDEMHEITANKQPIGKTENPKPFTSHLLPSSVTMLFLFTDGYADQFGGPRGKKFKYASLQKLLLETQQLSPQEQCLKLSEEFELWKGDLEQIDDVCIIGIRL